ncbi:MAG: CHAT domain-containing protein [Acidobacteria bacterium]|nr:CHAT domain-containing protein [Acidobacteriota bacterium]
MDAKYEALSNLVQLQIKVGGLYFQAETTKASCDYGAAHSVYQALIAESRRYLQASLDFNQRFPDLPSEIPPIARPFVNTLMVGADIENALGDRGAAEALRKEALEISRLHTGRKGTASSERQRAGSLAAEGRFNEAIVALMGARDVFLEENDLLSSARVAIDLADIFQWLGDNRRAKEEIEHAESIVRPEVAGGQPSQKDVLDSVAELKKEIERVQASIQSRLAGGQSSLRDSDEELEAGRVNRIQAERNAELYRATTEIVFYHGMIAKALEEWDEAERCFKEVLPEYQGLGLSAAIEYQFAQINIGRGQFRQALEQLRQIEHVFAGGAFRQKLPALQWAQARCLHALGESKEALRLVEEAIADLTGQYFDPNILWRCQWLRARICADLSKKKLALESLRSALETVSSLRRAPLGYRLDSTYMADKKEFYSYAIEATIKADAPLDCCRFIESIKSRTLTAVLSIPAADDGADAGLEGQLREVTQQLDLLEYQAYRERWNQERRLQHQELLEKRANLLERIRISDPRWRNLSEPVEFKFEELLAGLSKRSQAALTLYYEPPDLTAVLLFGGKVTAERLKVSEETTKSLADYAKNLQKALYDYNKHDISAEYSVLAEQLIPPSLLSQALEAESLVVVPHGLLHLIPWGGLLHEGARLFERLPVGILPNLGALISAEESSRPELVVTVGVSKYPGMELKIGDLPSVRSELEDIRSVYEEAGIALTDPLLDDAATEKAFWDTASGIKGLGNLLQMSCHGTIVLNEPMSSGLLLHDSKVDAAELARAALAFSEVVLSACSTGWRPAEVGDLVLDADEILGIPAGFLESGANSVLVSISKAEGKAARALTTHYHRRRVAGDSPLHALRSAQRHLLAQGIPPGTWLGFTLYGCV